MFFLIHPTSYLFNMCVFFPSSDFTLSVCTILHQSGIHSVTISARSLSQLGSHLPTVSRSYSVFRVGGTRDSASSRSSSLAKTSTRHGTPYSSRSHYVRPGARATFRRLHRSRAYDCTGVRGFYCPELSAFFSLIILPALIFMFLSFFFIIILFFEVCHLARRAYLSEITDEAVRHFLIIGPLF